MASGTIPSFITGATGVLTNADDLNNIYGVDKQGLYYIASGVANAPTDWAWLLVCGGLGTCQIVFTQSGTIYTRAYTGSPLIWLPWKLINNNPQAFTLTANNASMTDFGHNSYRYGNVAYCSGFFKTSANISSQAALISLPSVNHYRSEGSIIARQNGQATTQVVPIYTDDNGANITINRDMPAQSDWCFFNINILIK